jgi:phosphoribosylformylglycinamidine synthase subunit PurL
VDTSTAAADLPAPAPNPRDLARELGLTDDEYDRIAETLGRVPSTAELGAYSVMWSEHCSYKSSKVHLRDLPTEGDAVLVGPGENAGVVDVGGGLAVAFKIESHNHPSYVEPYQGATTGVGGIIRDILTMGARPIALLDPLRFGDPADPTTRRIVDGVVRGIGGYGNSIGVPTIGGEVSFDPCYAGNPLVNVLCVGVLPADRIQLAKAERVGDVAVLIGQRTGRDGIGGASVLASTEFGADGVEDAKRPNVQVGDPFAGKLLIETCLELYERDLLSGIQDMGAAGIICSAAEMASAAGLGMRVDLDRVPLREQDMEAWEILCSESQERMLALVSPERLDDVLGLCGRWGVDATPIGEVVDGDRLVMYRHGELVVDAPAASLADEGPTYHRPMAEWRLPEAAEDADAMEAPAALEDAVWAVLTDPDIAPARWVWEQYDGIVGSGTVQDAGGSAGVVRLTDDGRGVAVATDGNGRWCALDPEEGARLLVAEAARNVACTGARPVAATNNLNFASPQVAEVMGSFAATVKGMGEACRTLGTPITGGNVSFYNQTGDRPIHPTPVVGVLGVIDDVAEAVGIGFRQPGDVLLLVGAPTRPGLAGSAYQRAVEGRLAGSPPPVDLEAEVRLQRFLVERSAVLRSAHDVSGGGLVTTLVESCLAGDLGASVTPEAEVAPLQWLFSESPTRVLVSVAPGDEADVRAALDSLGVPGHRVGTVTGEPRLRVEGVLDVDLVEARRRRDAALPSALGEVAPVSAS